MKITSIKFHIDSGISVQCERTGEDEHHQISPEHLKNITVIYDISLINDPLKKVKEQCRIYNRNIKYYPHYFTLFFPLENIIQPHESQITFRSLAVFFKDNSKVKFPIDETYTFVELQKNSMESSIRTTVKEKNQGVAHENLQKGKYTGIFKKGE